MTVLMEVAGRSDRTKFRNQVLGPLLAEGLLEMTLPDKPRSSKQRYPAGGGGQELSNLQGAGIVCRRVEGKQIYFQADPDCPLLPEPGNRGSKGARGAGSRGRHV